MKTLVIKYRKIIIIGVLLVLVFLSASFVIIRLLQNLIYHPLVVILVEMTILLLSILGLIYVGIKKNIITFSKRLYWSIGIYVGQNPYEFHPTENVKNPVLTAQDVTDIKADFVADPFMIKENSTWYMFFEVMNALTKQGDIGLAVSEDGFNWDYKQIILNEPYHLSYPYVFKWKEEYYMIPQSGGYGRINLVNLYKAHDFPTKWSLLVENLVSGDYVDPSIFYYNDNWWLFVCTPDSATLKLYYSDELLGPWVEHAKSPIIMNDASIAQPGGRVLVLDNHIVRYTQDNKLTYGKMLQAFEIIRLTKTMYEENEAEANPILKAHGFGWNRHGMHHIDAHQIDTDKWLACVDGYKKYLTIQIEY